LPFENLKALSSIEGSYTEEDWIDEEATSHREPDD